MLYLHNTDEYESKVHHEPCPFHKRNPGGNSPACTCSTSWGLQRKPEHQIKIEREAKTLAHEEAVLAEADAIRARRAARAAPE